MIVFSDIIKNQFLLYKRSFAYIRPYWQSLIVAILLSVVLSLTSGFATYSFLPVFNIVFQQNNSTTEKEEPTTFIGEVINNKIYPFFMEVAGQGSEMSQLIRLVIIIVILSLLSIFLLFIVDYIFLSLQSKGNEHLRRQSFHHLTALPMHYFVKNKSGVILSKLTNDVGGTVSLVTQSISHIVLNSLQSITFLFLLFFIEFKLALLILPLAIIGTLATLLIGRWVRRNRQRILALQGDVFAIIQEFLAGIKTIKLLSAEDFERQRWEKWINHWRKLEFMNGFNKILPTRLIESTGILFLAIFVSIGGWLIVNNSLTVAELLLFLIVLGRFQISASALGRVWFQVQDGMAFAQRAFSLFDVATEPKFGQKVQKKIAQGFKFDNVLLDYGDGPILKNIQFEIPVGKTIALVGPSGSGKSSLAGLLVRLFNPTRGSIYLDGVDTREFDIEQYRRLFGVVTQDTFLFHDSVKNNIIYAVDRPVSDSEIMQATSIAHAHKFIEDLPNGYNTVIGDRGIRLSGGQQQRIAIARAVLRQPACLVFDEATSALDTESERQVQTAMEDVLRNQTALVIAHRLSTIVRADQILVLNEGQIIERGTHEDLLHQDGLYRHLWGLQTSHQ